MYDHNSNSLSEWPSDFGTGSYLDGIVLRGICELAMVNHDSVEENFVLHGKRRGTDFSDLPTVVH